MQIIQLKNYSLSFVMSLLVSLLAVGLLCFTMAYANQPMEKVEKTATESTQSIQEDVSFVDFNGVPLANSVGILCYDLTGVTTTLQLPLTNDGRPTNPQLLTSCETIVALDKRYVHQSAKHSDIPAFTIYATSGEPDLSELTPVAPEGTIELARPLILFDVLVSFEWTPTASYTQTFSQGLQKSSVFLSDMTEGTMAFRDIHFAYGGKRWNEADIRVLATNDMRPAANVGGIMNQPKEYASEAFPVNSTPPAPDPIFKPGAIYLGRYWNGESAHTGNWDEVGFRTLVHEWGHYALFLFDEYIGPGVKPYFCTAKQPTETGASVMYSDMSASELWHPKHTPVPSNACENTDQFRIHGESDWETLSKWYEIQGIGSTSLSVPLAAAHQDDISLPAIAIPENAPEPSDIDYTDESTWGVVQELIGIRFDQVTPAPSDTPTPVPTDTPLATETPTPQATESVTSSINLPIMVNGEDLQLGAVRVANTSQSQTVQVRIPDDQTVNLGAQIYVLKNGQSESGLPSQIVYQGTLIGEIGDPEPNVVGKIELLDVNKDKDLVSVLIDQYSYAVSTTPQPGRRLGSEQIFEDEVSTEQTIEEGEEASLDIVYGLEHYTDEEGLEAGLLVSMTLVLDAPDGDPPLAQLCMPDASIGCTDDEPDDSEDWVQQMVYDDANQKWTATFTPHSSMKELPPYSIVRVNRPEDVNIIRWIQDLSGVGGGHMLAGAPLREGRAMIDQIDLTPTVGFCNRVIIMPAANGNILNRQRGNDTRLVSLPLDVDILFQPGALDNGPLCQSRTNFLSDGDGAEDEEMRITLSYNEEALRRANSDGEGIIFEESELTIVYQPNAIDTSGWTVVQPEEAAITINTEQNWISTVVSNSDENSGIYAVAYVPPTPASDQLSSR